MHKTMIGAAVGLALLVSALLSWDANATTLTGFGTLSSLGASPVQTLARAEDATDVVAATFGGAVLPARVPCSAFRSEFYCIVNPCHWQRWSMTWRWPRHDIWAAIDQW